MSLIKSATRRVTLLAGSSLIAVSLSAAASLGLALTPTAALAYDECAPTPSTGTQTDGANGVSDPTLNGATADSFTCAVATYPTGIRYTSGGDLSVNVIGTQVSPATPTLANYGTGGVVTTATGADAVTLRLTGSTASSTVSFNSAFPVLLDAQSQSGDVLVDVATAKTAIGNPGSLTANNAATRRFVRAVSTAGGDVTVKITAAEPSGRGTSITATGAADAAAIEARSVGGGNVIVDMGAGTERIATGRLYGIIAEADGAGAVTVIGTAAANTSVAGSAGVRVVAGTGAVTITSAKAIDGDAAAFSGQTGVYVDARGNVNFTGAASGSGYGINLINLAAGTTSTLQLGTVSQRNVTNAVSGGTAAIRATGAGKLDVQFLGIQRAMNFDFLGMSAPVEVAFKAGGAWIPIANVSSVVPDGNFSISLEAGSALLTGETASGNNTLEPATVLTFAPAGSLKNAGVIVVGPDKRDTGHARGQFEAELRLVGLKDFRHSGDILLGGCGQPCGQRPNTARVQGVTTSVTDGSFDDLLTFQDGVWIGEEGRVTFDADLNLTQTNCVRTAVTNSFGAADCLRIVNSTVEGVTYVNIAQTLAGDRGRLTQQIMDEGIVLIETPGSTVTAENFAVDPQMDGYNPASASLDKGIFQYVLLFDDAADQFKLFGTLSGAAYQLPMAATAAHNLWRLSTGSWLNRQADLRGGAETGIGGGVWMRASAEQTDREVTSVTTLGGLPFATDNNHRADTYAVTGGLDLLSASHENMAYVLGVTAGYAHSDIGYGASANTQAMDAWSGGLYGSVIAGSLFVDAVVNANNVIIDTDAPGFQLSPDGTIYSSRMVSLGGQVEAGWRLLFDGGFFAEPMASVSYVRSQMDELQIQPDDLSRPGLEVSFEDPSSFRAGVGARFGVDTDLAGMRTQMSLLARTWNDLEGQNTAVINNLAFPDDEPVRVVDEFSDQFNEVAVGASLWAPNGVVSGFLNLGGKWGEGYEAKTGSVGVRVAW